MYKIYFTLIIANVINSDFPRAMKTNPVRKLFAPRHCDKDTNRSVREMT